MKVKEELKYQPEPMHIDFESKLKEKDELVEIVRHDTILSSLKKEKPSPNGFLNSSLIEDTDDDSEMPPDVVNNNKASFNTSYNDDIVIYHVLLYCQN